MEGSCKTGALGSFSARGSSRLCASGWEARVDFFFTCFLFSFFSFCLFVFFGSPTVIQWLDGVGQVSPGLGVERTRGERI